MSDTEITFTGAYTCTHHNDRQRAECPVCLVSALTTELKLLREWQREVISSARAHHAERKDAIERAERAETVALANWGCALERAMKAEADLVALEQCHDDNCRAVVKIAAELTALTAERGQLRAEVEQKRDLLVIAIRSAGDQATRAERAEAELATERARMKKIETALKEAISTYFEADKLVTAERIEAWQAALKEDAKSP